MDISSIKPRIIFLSGREVEYIRNRILLTAMRRCCNVIVLTGHGRNIISRSTISLLKWFLNRPMYDIAFVGFYGQPLVIILAALQRRPVILDAFVSTFDTLCEDRKLFRPHSIPGRLAYWIDQKSYQLADLILTDTWANARYFSSQFGIPEEKFKVIYVGCDESIFYPRLNVSSHASRCEVFYYSSFLPLHGIDVVIRAAVLLKNRRDIHFTIGGHGPLFKSVQQMIRKFRLKNVDLVGWIPLERLPLYIANANICLGGHFSLIPKAARVIATKTYQFIAMRKPTIVGDNPATRELFIHRMHIYAVPMGDPLALANGIAELAETPTLRDLIAENGYMLFKSKLTIEAMSNQLESLVRGLSAHLRCNS